MKTVDKITRRSRALIIIALTVAACAVMAVVDGVIEPAYAVKSAVKLAVFAAVPIAYMLVFRDADFKRFLTPDFKRCRRRIAAAAIVGAVVCAVIIGGYFALRGIVDFSAVTVSLAEGEGVTRDNFIFVAIYISVVNSFCEELMFRGFAFGALRACTSRRFAYIFSPVCFAVYHVAIMSGWFSPIVTALLILALCAAGVIFNAADDMIGKIGDRRGGSDDKDADCIYPSYIIHMMANLGINTVGVILFGII